MFHPDTQFLIDLWSRLARSPGARGGVPSRRALQPETLGPRLPRAFMLDASADPHVMRLTGGWVQAFHGEAARPGDLFSLWTEGSRDQLTAALGRTVREGRPVVLSAKDGAYGVAVEIALAPLRSSSGRVDRILGLYAPIGAVTPEAEASRRLTARLSVAAGEAGRAPLTLAAVGGRRIA